MIKKIIACIVLLGIAGPGCNKKIEKHASPILISVGPDRINHDTVIEFRGANFDQIKNTPQDPLIARFQGSVFAPDETLLGPMSFDLKLYHPTERNRSLRKQLLVAPINEDLIINRLGGSDHRIFFGKVKVGARSTLNGQASGVSSQKFVRLKLFPQNHQNKMLKVLAQSELMELRDKGVEFAEGALMLTIINNIKISPSRGASIGDIVLTVDGKEVLSPEAFAALTKGAQKLKLTVLRRSRSQARIQQAQMILHPEQSTIKVKPVAPHFVITKVLPESDAYLAGVSPGDTILALNDKLVTARTDLVLALQQHKNVMSERPLELKLKQTSGTVSTVTLAKEVERSITLADIPTWLIYGVIGLVVSLFYILIIFSLFAGIASWVERRIAGRMQSRIGPNRVGPQGFLQWLADGLKNIQKEDLIPKDAYRTFYLIAPYFVFLGVFLTFVTLPFGQMVIVSDLSIGIFYILAVTSIVVVGIIIGGWSSNNKWSLMGGMRSAAQIVSYEIPHAVAILTIVLLAQSMSMQQIIHAQGGAPYNWFIFHSPFTFVCFFIYFVAALAEGNRTPFDLPEAEQELVSGYNTEYSGMRFLFFLFAEWANLYVIGAIATTLFFGGWQIPGISEVTQESSIYLQMFGWALFTLKSLIFVFIIIQIRWTLPRLRIDQMMVMCWKYLVPIAFVCFLGAAVYVALQTVLPAIVYKGVKWVMFGVGCLILIQFFRRAYYNWKMSGEKLHINPFI